MEKKENIRKRSLTVTTILTMLAIIVVATFTCKSMAQNVSNKYADNVVVTLVNNDSDKISPGDQVQLHAVVKLGDTEADMQYVNWSVSGNKDVNTKIDANGVLYIGTNETVGDTLTVTAEAEIQFGVKGSISIDINTYSYYSLRAMPVGTTTTVTIDGVEWYILAKDGDKALLWSKDPVGKKQYFSSLWNKSTLRTHLNTELLNTLPILKEKAVATKIYTRSSFYSSNWMETIDKVFILNSVDINGRINQNGKVIISSNPKDYTYGNKPFVPFEMLSYTPALDELHDITSPDFDFSWLRSNDRIMLNCMGTISVVTGNGKWSVRPALWVTMP